MNYWKEHFLPSFFILSSHSIAGLPTLSMWGGTYKGVRIQGLITPTLIWARSLCRWQKALKAGNPIEGSNYPSFTLHPHPLRKKQRGTASLLTGTVSSDSSCLHKLSSGLPAPGGGHFWAFTLLNLNNFTSPGKSSLSKYLQESFPKEDEWKAKKPGKSMETWKKVWRRICKTQ